MGDSKHNISEAEKMGIVEYINSEINAGVDPRSAEIFERTKDGTILARVIDSIKPGTIAIDKLNTDFSSDQKIFKMLQNQQMVLEGAKKLGCNIVNIGGQDLVDGTAHLTMGVLWQVVRVGLLTKVASLFGDSMGMPPEQLLLRWMNYHLTKANYSTVVTNFSSDLQNGEALTYLLNQLAPQNCDLGPLTESELPKRCESVLQNADKIGCRKFVTAQDIYKGNGRLLLAFVATLFLKFPDMGERDEILKLKERITQLEEENRTLMLNYQLQMKQVDEEFTRKILSIETLLSEEQALKREHQLKLEQMERENREALSQHRKELERLNSEFELRMQAMKAELLAEKELALKEHSAQESEKMEVIKRTAREQEMKDKDEIEKLKAEVALAKQTLEQTKQAEQEDKQNSIRKITIQAEEQKVVLVKTFEEKEKNYLAEIENLKRLLRECMDREEKLRKGMLTMERQGFLVKKGNSGGKMQKRWFVLRGEYLLYFKGKDAQNLAHPAGSIYLVTATFAELDEKETVARSGDKALKAGFEIRCPDSDNRVYFLVADDVSTRTDWLESFKASKGAYYIRVKEGNKPTGLSPRASTKVD